jgi:hypothetical protein
MSTFDGYDYDPGSDDVFQSGSRSGRNDQPFYVEEVEVEVAPQYASHGIEAALHDLFEFIAKQKQMPLSASALVPREEALTRIENVMALLPEEIREARRALRDREDLMQATEASARQLREQVQAQASRMIENTEIMREARARGEQVIIEAQERAHKMINEAEDFIDGKLGNFEIVLDRLLKTARSGRERLNAHGLPTSLVPTSNYGEVPPAAEALGEVAFDSGYDQYEVSADSPAPFFDQDEY